jgi:mRNA-degrading endonuclease RelE of RelBE toxin-antitoxin system
MISKKIVINIDICQNPFYKEGKHKQMAGEWSVRFSSSAEKQYIKLKRSGTRPCITDVIDLFVIELQKNGPFRTNWPHYGRISKGYYHCHLKRGRPTYVACWTIVSEKEKRVEVCYVGTHEDAPY